MGFYSFGTIQKRDHRQVKKNYNVLWLNFTVECIYDIQYQHKRGWNNWYEAPNLLLWITGCIPTSENQLFGNYTFCTSPASFMGHYESGSDMILFLKVSGFLRTINMRYYSFYSTRFLKVHVIEFKFYIHKNILNLE